MCFEVLREQVGACEKKPCRSVMIGMALSAADGVLRVMLRGDGG
jgi:hypothetical protein